MNKKNKHIQEYRGFEQGPIRPPSEASSLLVRVTRNCPWNRCTFCRAYKGSKFSLRPVEHVKKDIDTIFKYIRILKKTADESGHISRDDMQHIASNVEFGEIDAFYAAVNWYATGMKSVFLQDANSLIIKSKDLVNILTHLKTCFPWVERITSYARSHTIARIEDNDLKAIAEAGLNRIHIGLESGSDQVLKMIKKGVDKKTHIKAGLKVKNAGIELSEYVMPGLGGRKYSKIHALETAKALNIINPHFIRIRTLTIPNNIELFKDYKAGRFEKCTDLMMAKEILTLIENLEHITSIIKSDHILNLFQDLEGKLPDDKEKMMNIIKKFLKMDPQRQCVYQIGRRMGLLSGLNDLDNPDRLARVEKACVKLGVTPENIDVIVEQLMNNFI